MKIEALHNIYLTTEGIVTDTRKIKENTLFFALKGDNFNGNTFAEEALKKGASFAVVDEEKFQTSENIILVENCLDTLQQLAKYHREYLNIPIISLTGSNGKTTTKELINAVLSKKFKTVATQGNLNNHIGVPLTLLSMDKTTEIGVVEMGANHLKEIESLCNIAHPNYGYITNFGKAHLEGFGGVEGVIKGKSELYNHLIKSDKTIFYNADDSIQTEKLSGYKHKVGFSQKENTDYQIKLQSADPFVTISYNDTNIQSNLIGTYNFTNIAIAITIGTYFDIPTEAIKDAIENYKPTNNRSQIITSKKHEIILDAYNANPSSMKVALENFSQLNTEGKVVILGDMFELGNEATREHQNIASLAENLNFDLTLLVGENFFKTTTKSQKLKTFNDLKTYIENNNIQQKNILIKGSRGMALERILESLE
ncbi:UDP-N-acetylmuramoyl-tripeptide--D-alanyl-D-alanine ligase [Joostella sp. CR20]|uniref:UDP-N-acetylmuramoyl-tripeptide--D-alanyl-D- alanine ligase n=1 Tax=Joostella sp. CR20 TaxID=2804312 RepID=UPI00313E4876